MTGRVERTEAGLTLVEVIVTVAILGISFVAILGGMWTSIVTSDTHRKQALATTYLVNAAEHVKAQHTTSYAPCVATYSLSSLPPASVPAEWRDAMNVSVKHWDGVAFGTTCLAETTLLDLQEVTISVTSPVDGRAAEALTFVKRPS